MFKEVFLHVYVLLYEKKKNIDNKTFVSFFTMRLCQKKTFLT